MMIIVITETVLGKAYLSKRNIHEETVSESTFVITGRPYPNDLTT